MIPDENQAKKLWETYHLPVRKQQHVTLVGRVVLFFARQLETHHATVSIDKKLLYAAALLHDIDTSVPPAPGERHPDTAVRILREENMNEVADIVVTHSVHAILDPAIAPKTWEEKLLFLSDKMVKNEIGTVEQRFALWRAEKLPQDEQDMLDSCYPLVLSLERTMCTAIGVAPRDIAKLA